MTSASEALACDSLVSPKVSPEVLLSCVNRNICHAKLINHTIDLSLHLRIQGSRVV